MRRPRILQTTIFVDPAAPGALQTTIFVDPAPPESLQTTIFVDPTPRRLFSEKQAFQILRPGSKTNFVRRPSILQPIIFVYPGPPERFQTIIFVDPLKHHATNPAAARPQAVLASAESAKR